MNKWPGLWNSSRADLLASAENVERVSALAAVMSAEDFEFGMELARGIAVDSEVMAAAGEMELETEPSRVA